MADGGPGFWMDETSGVLAPVVLAYLHGRELTTREVAIMRSYLRQWIGAPAWDENPHGGSDELEQLRAAIDGIATRSDIAKWLDQALDFGIDPL